jgi:glycosyltransferase involved in cell wall biosynthesis
VIRTYVWPYSGKTIWKRFLNYGSFALLANWGARRLDPYDLVYVYHPPLTISQPAHLAARRCQVPLVYDIQDLWPEAGVVAGAISPGVLYRLLSAWARWAYARSTHITVIAPDFRDSLVAQGVSPDKISVVPNWADEELYVPQPANGVRRQYGLREDAFLVMYAGNLGSTHGVEYLLEAARLLRDRQEIIFAFVGTGPEHDRMLRVKESLGLANVTFLGYVQPASRLPGLLASADLMLVHLLGSGSGAVSLPSRMLAYMACGRPMLVASHGAPRRLVEEAGCGVVCEPGDPRAIATSIVQLATQPDYLAEMGANGRQAYLAKFSETVVVTRLVRLLEEIAGGGAVQ